ncbi:hypothetical protein MTO96_031253 [Rhipicephalus appendiculatus]
MALSEPTLMALLVPSGVHRSAYAPLRRLCRGRRRLSVTYRRLPSRAAVFAQRCASCEEAVIAPSEIRALTEEGGLPRVKTGAIVIASGQTKGFRKGNSCESTNLLTGL